MPLPNTPPIGLVAIQIEYGAPAGTGLLAMVAGGAYVPAGAVGINGPIPSSAPISCLDFLGGDAGGGADPFESFTLLAVADTEGIFMFEGYFENRIGSMTPDSYRGNDIWYCMSIGTFGFLDRYLGFAISNGGLVLPDTYVDEIRIVSGPGSPYLFKLGVNLSPPIQNASTSTWNDTGQETFDFMPGETYGIEISWKA